MPIKRRKTLPTSVGISAAALVAWHEGDWHKLNSELKIQLFEVSPFDVDDDAPLPAWVLRNGERSSPWATSWPKAVAVRKQLIEAAGQPGRHDRHGRPLGPAAEIEEEEDAGG